MSQWISPQLHNPPGGSARSEVPWSLLPLSLPQQHSEGSFGVALWGWPLPDQGGDPRFCSVQCGVKISATDVQGVIALHRIGGNESLGLGVFVLEGISLSILGCGGSPSSGSAESLSSGVWNPWVLGLCIVRVGGSPYSGLGAQSLRFVGLYPWILEISICRVGRSLSLGLGEFPALGLCDSSLCFVELHPWASSPSELGAYLHFWDMRIFFLGFGGKSSTLGLADTSGLADLHPGRFSISSSGWTPPMSVHGGRTSVLHPGWSHDPQPPPHHNTHIAQGLPLDRQLLVWDDEHLREQSRLPAFQPAQQIWP